MDENNAPNRKSIRLKEFDYSTPGNYFITICSFYGMRLFGEILNNEMGLSPIGGIVKDEWLKTAHIRKNVKLDTFVVMPNHFHGILFIEDRCKGTARRARTEESFGRPTGNSIPTIVRSFKSAVTRRAREMLKSPEYVVWHRNYYEHIIRNNKSLNKIRQYIMDNSANWHLDRENPEYQGVENKYPETWMS
ncbi:MAG: transposase [Nitrospinae bacterium]|nr:transposase [Nitrospinota bacterium]